MKPPSFLDAASPSPKATPAQLNKLLVMLHKAELISGEYDKDAWEWEYDVHEAYLWVVREMGWDIHSLSDLTHRQIGLCFKELGESSQ